MLKVDEEEREEASQIQQRSCAAFILCTLVLERERTQSTLRGPCRDLVVVADTQMRAFLYVNFQATQDCPSISVRCTRYVPDLLSCTDHVAQRN